MYHQRISPYEHIIESQQFDETFLSKIFDLTNQIRESPKDFQSELKGRIVSMVFYETSTRTRMSFESAALRMGAGTIHTENAKDFSSVSKGESLEDTIKVISNYCDFLILRHSENNSSKRVVPFSEVPLINGGSGSEQHPTQALLDVYTIFRNFNRLNNLKIMVVGDLLRGRTCDSLVYLLSKYEGNKFCFVSPENCRIRDDLKRHLEKTGQLYEETKDMELRLGEVDVVYMTRIQQERFESALEYEQTKGKYILTPEGADTMRKESIIMHPLPRVDEIHPAVDSNHRAKFFDQVENGVFTRMALLKILNDTNYK